MNAFLFYTLATVVLLFLTLSYTLLSMLSRFPASTVFCYLLSALAATLFYYLLYVKTTQKTKHHELHSLLTIADLKNEKTALKQQLEIVENLISRDPLTSLWNRSYCLNRLQEELNRTRRSGGTFSVLMIDLDHFKAINDDLGHLVGDDYLTAFSEMLLRHTRCSDVACRYGGDEFFVILPDTPIEGAVSAAEKLNRRANEIIIHPKYPLQISIGICNACETAECVEDIINCADTALYQAKKEGRNRASALSHIPK